MADATGVETVHPRLTTSSWRIEGLSCTSLDSFPDYRLGEPDPGADGRPLLTVEISGFGVAQTPTAYFRERRLLLTLESSSSLSATGSSLLCGLGQLFELALVGLADAGRLEGGLMFFVRPRHRGSPPSRRGCGSRKELTSLSSHAFVRSMTWAWCHSRHLPKKLAP